ncbi:conserved hypothetical protein [Desulfotalea psychrophila LSv54]|uniref:ATP-dependent DNA ligase n=2 Tax=Desulfotalea psychrophila TaxID=84980 RepID=Q6AQ86_DESPS|nr:conserved hypothetical protein [Desulfotalea psychrophila LSv54]
MPPTFNLEKNKEASMIKKTCCLSLLLSLLASPALAHFGMLIPDSDIIGQKKRTANIQLSFSHPFELVGMDLAMPASFTVTSGGKTRDLKPRLRANSLMGHQAWQTDYSFKRPGIYQFVMEPQPYWEPGEDLSIIHYTKTIIPAFGDDEGWDQALGLPAEIVPRLRPFGNYAGNTFVGQVLIKGKPLAHAEVEVEFYNRDNKFSAPSDYHVTQVIKADRDGVFSFSCPQAGWWGFAALTEADYTLKNPQGEDKGVEIGAVLWTYMHPLSTIKNSQ